MLLLLLLLVLWLVWYSRKLTLTGTAAAGIIAILIYAGTGWKGISLLGAFFILGILATGYKKDYKVAQDLVPAQSNRRNAGQVFANGGIAGLCGLIASIFPAENELMLLMLAGALSAATADTLASELGMVHGRRCFNILTLQPDQKGLDGVISLEGSLLGAVGSFIIAILLWAMDGGQWLFAVVVAGTLGNLLDSFMGATLERKGRLSNDWVNAANTAAGAVAMAIFYAVWA